MLTPKVLYLGDDDPTRAAAYLCGVMTKYEIDFERVDSCASPAADFQSQSYAAYILSDYAVSNFNAGDMEHIVKSVRENGSGLLMLGGWESYYGRLGEYGGTPIADILPVVMQDSDDRRNYSSPVLLRPTTLDHPIVKDLPWETAPGVGGYNRFEAKPDAQVLLEGYRTKTTWKNLVADPNAAVDQNDVQLELLEKFPFLVVGNAGKGRVAAFASDVAPHWIGGMVDWGTPRVFQELPEKLGKDLFVEIGCDYAKYFAQLVRWTAAL